MATQYTNILKLALPVQGELTGTWGDTVNDEITSLVEEAVAGLVTINTWTANAHTLTVVEGATSESRAAILKLTDTGTALTGQAEVITPATTKIYVVDNQTGQPASIKVSGGADFVIPNGEMSVVYGDGTRYFNGVTFVPFDPTGTGLAATNIQDALVELDGLVDTNTSDILLKAPIASPTFTGTVTTPALTLGATPVTATGAELNILDGVTATTAELNFVDGVTSNIQAQINSKASATSPTFTGTVTIPEYIVHASDTNTFFGFPIVDTFTVTTAGVERMRVDALGEVGIGTTTPLRLLHIKGINATDTIPMRVESGSTATSCYIDFVDSNTTSNFFNRVGSIGNNLAFWANNAERMRIDSSGNVGIGTNTPSTKLEVSGDITITDASTILQMSASAGSFNAVNFGDNLADFVGQILYNHANDTMAFTANGAERMRIDSSGNVGIGQQNPSVPLHIGNTSSSGTALNIQSSITGANSLNMGDTNPNAGRIIYNNSNNNMQFVTNAAEQMRIDGDGKLLVGKTSSNSATVGCEVQQDALFVTNSGNGSLFLNRLTNDGEIVRLRQDNANHGSIGVASGGMFFGTGTGLDERMRIDSTGNVGIATSSPTEKLTIDGNIALLGASAVTRFSIVENVGIVDYKMRTENYSLSLSSVGASTSFIRFSTGATETERMRIDSTGDVLIKRGRLKISESDSDTDAIVLTRDANEGAIQVFGNGSQTINIAGDGDSWFNSGNLGIGTTSPTADLSVGSTSATTGNAAFRTTRTTFDITPSNSDGGGVLFDLGWAVGGQGSFRWALSGSEAMRITSAGDVGIGKTAPFGKLHIGDTGDAFTRVYIESSSTGTSVLGLGDADNLVDAGFSYSNSTRVLTLIAGSGTTQATFATTEIDFFNTLNMNGFSVINQSSIDTKDIDFREDVYTSLAKVCNIGNIGVAVGNYKGETEKKRFLIAEEVAEVIPEVVKFDEDGKPSGIAYSELMADAYSAIAALKLEVDGLRAELNELKGKQ